ncbi:unnamed protein product [Macrosiphum euphorbiae]|uniref:Uncharacterized protein n=1 Tax=Macrosiphum euphorbiae TaxID=13131 RepID=A0AAV0VVJ4_9HEMI|nr:unnamed protein product [Macrosiphum euphorbiae]
MDLSSMTVRSAFSKPRQVNLPLTREHWTVETVTRPRQTTVIRPLNDAATHNRRGTSSIAPSVQTTGIDDNSKPIATVPGSA